MTMLSLSNNLQPSRLIGLSPWLYENTKTECFANPTLSHLNQTLFNQLGINSGLLTGDNILYFISDGCSSSAVKPISTIYAGHQFGIYTSTLGDGRVHILGDINTTDHERWEVQLKGAGATPYARGNNGRMGLSEAILEYLGCEAMAGLGIPSTRGLALISHAGDNSDLNNSPRECILVRTAETHLRFGHLEYFHNQGQTSYLKELIDHIISHHYPDIMDMDEQNRYLGFLYAVILRTTSLLAQWQSVGFVHSVMNTDNMSIVGITIDFGVYGFMQSYDPAYSPNVDDDQNRYAFDQQIDVARWNCLALAEAMVTLLPDMRIPANLLRFYRKSFSENYLALMRKKLGLLEYDGNDSSLTSDLFHLLSQQGIDYTHFFRQLSSTEVTNIDNMPALAGTDDKWRKDFKSWCNKYIQRLTCEKTSPAQRMEQMLRINPRYILRPRTIEHIIQAAEQDNDFGPLADLVRVLQSPFEEHKGFKFLD